MSVAPSKTSQHTPGPWTTAATDDTLILKGRLKIASTYPIGLDLPQEEANARLIAAAPDLLESCRDLLALLRTVAPEYAESTYSEFARAAIATALGSNGAPLTRQDGQLRDENS